MQDSGPWRKRLPNPSLFNAKKNEELWEDEVKSSKNFADCCTGLSTTCNLLHHFYILFSLSSGINNMDFCSVFVVMQNLLNIVFPHVKLHPRKNISNKKHCCHMILKPLLYHCITSCFDYYSYQTLWKSFWNLSTTE